MESNNGNSASNPPVHTMKKKISDSASDNISGTLLSAETTGQELALSELAGLHNGASI